MALAGGVGPSISTFVRLKLRLVGNGMRGSGQQTTFFVLGCLFGLGYAVVGSTAFVATAFARTHTAVAFAGIAGASIVLAWLVLPTLFFGVDETLDPARFALLPLAKWRLIGGMTAAALAGIPALATAVVLLGAIVGSVAHRGALAALVGLLGAPLTLLFCVTGSRAITSALATALRSRRTRDTASIVLALLAASIGPLQIAGVSLFSHSATGPLAQVARVLGWTPLAAGLVAPYDRNPLIALARLAVEAACVALTAWWWSSSLESAMIGTATGGGRARPSKGSAVAGFVPWFLRGASAGPFTGILTRELRYWVRDPRRRVGLISVGVAGIVTPLALRLNERTHGFGGPPLSLTAAFSGVLGGVLLLQVFSFDGTAYATHILAGVRPRTEIAARAAGVAILVVPLIVSVTVVVGLVIGRLDDVQIALGTALGSFGSSLGAAGALAVAASYPLPESRNMFAMNTGTGSARGLLGFVVMIGTLVVALPVYVLAFFLPSAVELGFGALWGAAAVAGGIAVGAARLRGHGPELLLAVTPRR